MGSLPKYWVKTKEPEAGVYKLVLVTGWSPQGNMREHKCLYVLESLDGYLSECIEPTTEIPNVWQVYVS